MIRKSFLGVALTSASIFAVVGAAGAQEAPKPAQQTAAQAAKDEPKSDKDTVVVTAQKREERVQDVPISVAVVNSEQLERQQINNILDLTKVSPALELTNAAGQSPGGGAFIRGLGTTTFGVGAVGAVGIVVDGVSQGNANISDLYDIQRVEVLKGPQGTLFGLTTSAGVINITTQAPTGKFGVKVRTELSDEGTAGSTGYGEQIYQGSVNVPFGDKAGLRVSANINSRQGPDRNALDGSLDEFDTWGARARLFLEPIDHLTINFNADYAKDKNHGPDFFVVYKATDAFTTALANCRLSPTAPITPVVVSDSNRDYCSTTNEVGGSKNYGGSASVDYDLGPVTLTSITAARRTQSLPYGGLDIFRLRNAYFNNPIPVPPFVSSSGFVGAPSEILAVGSANPGPTNLFTQEFRAASPSGVKLEYTLGVFYSDTTTTSNGGGYTQLTAYPGPGAPGSIVNGIPAVALFGGSNTQFSEAVFGQATYHVTDKLGIIFGARYTEDTLKQTSISNAGVVTSSRAENNNTSYRVGLQYQFDTDTMTYASLARGYKGAQFAAPICSGVCPPGTPQRAVSPEIPTSYEIGAKKTMFDGRAVLDLSAFYIDMKNYQGQTCVTDPATTLLTCTIANFDGVKSKGIEADLFGRISDNFTINTGLIWNPATYPTHGASGGPFKASDGTDLSDEQLSNVPEWKFTFSGEYSRPLTGTLEGFVSGDLVYRSKMHMAASADPNLEYPASTIVGARFGVRPMGGLWSVAIFGRNLTDEHIPVLRQGGFPTAGNFGQFLTTQSFRVVGLSLSADY